MVVNERFEEPLDKLRSRIRELREYPEEARPEAEIAKLEGELKKTTADVYGKLDRWQQTLVARHSDRPFTLDYVERWTDDWFEIHGDRCYSDDPAIVSGFATFRGRSIAIIGHQKGRGTKERIHRNFGQPRPEGYRKALRVMKLAERFGRPILTLIDTPGAYPGIGAEERGQAEAIARNLLEMATLRVPVVVTVTGEGGSGGALALGIGNRVLMLQYSTYSVISPEGCAAILWKDQNRKAEAAEAMRISSADCLKLGIVDEVVREPLGGAHSNPDRMAETLASAVDKAFESLADYGVEELIAQRYERFRNLGVYEES